MNCASEFIIPSHNMTENYMPPLKSPGKAIRKMREKEKQRREFYRERLFREISKKDEMFSSPKKPRRNPVGNAIKTAYASVKKTARATVFASALIALSSNPFPDLTRTLVNYGSAVANQISEISQDFGDLKDWRHSPFPENSTLEKKMFEDSPAAEESLYEMITGGKKEPKNPAVKEQIIISDFDINNYLPLPHEDSDIEKQILKINIDNLRSLSQALIENPKETMGLLAKKKLDSIMCNKNAYEEIYRTINKMEVYVPTIKSFFQDNLIPEELAFLPLVESNMFDPKSKNPESSAKGVWQILEGTAKQLLLAINQEEDIDERNNPIIAAEKVSSSFASAHLTLGNYCLALMTHHQGLEGIARRVVNEQTKSCETLYVVYGKELEKFIESEKRKILEKNPKIKPEGLEKKLDGLETTDRQKERILYLSEVLAKLKWAKENRPEVFYAPASKEHFKIQTVHDSSEKYAVQPNDTLWGIAGNFAPESSAAGRKIIVDKIKEASKIYMDKIRAKQILTINYTPKNLREFAKIEGMNYSALAILNPHINPGKNFPKKVRIVTYKTPAIRDALTQR